MTGPHRLLPVVGALIASAALVVIPAAPAAAHAVLLRTVPAPQSTVERAPARVSFEFSERVDIAPGAIRVYDVNARRVDRGVVQMTTGGRGVDVPLPKLSVGTYSVTWRAVSADGHPVRGGFVFYIGAPSSISAAALPSNNGAGRAVGWTFGVARFAWFFGIIVVLGALAARRLVWTPALQYAGAVDSAAASVFRAGFRSWILGGWLVALVGGLARVGFEGASVAGLTITDAIRPSTIRAVFHTAYGRLWWWEFALLIVLAVPLVMLTRRTRPPGGPQVWLAVASIDAVALCLATARNGHARTDSHPLVATVSVALHLLALAIWIGGLLTLLTVGLRGWRALPANERPSVLRAVVTRFSQLAIVAVVVVIITGTINSWFDFARFSDLWHNAYGRAVLAKIVLLLVALALASRHLFVVPKRLAHDEAERAAREVRAFERSGTIELIVLTATIAVAAGLVALVPGRSLALAASAPRTIERRLGAITVQLLVDDSDAPAQVHLTFVDDSGITVASVTAVSNTMQPPQGPAVRIDMRLISPGHFVGDATLSGPGHYQFTVSGRNGATPFTTTIPLVYKPAASSR